jgi:serine/threonine-protein kinase
MGYLEGHSLKERLEEGPLAVDETLRVAKEIGEGLSAAHAKGIVHRDVKPGNVMVTPEGRAVLMDFGLAKRTGSTTLTRTGVTVGTVSYMSPEQARGEQVDQRTDIWSLGTVLYEMTTGTLPFTGDYEHAVVYRILNEDPQPITSLRPDVPIELERIVMKTLQKDRNHRYERVDDMLTDLGLLTKHLLSEQSKVQATRRVDKYRIAVLPFTNISPDPQDEYFADGMTEELISTLSRIRGLRVIARTSVMKYKGASKTVSDIGRELKVGALIEGSVRKAVNKLRISAQLVDVQTEEHVWSQDYDRELDNVFDIQKDVAQQVAAALKVELLAGEQQALDKKPAGNLEAYTLYLKGRYFWNKFSEEGLQASIAYFERAIEKDPRYALAYVGLAGSYSVLGINYMPPLEVFPKAKAALESALGIDAGLAEAHVVLGSVKIFFDWDWPAAERELKCAIEINPNDATAHELYAYCLEVMGRAEEAFVEIRLAQELDPLSLVISCDVGIRYYFARQYDQAIDQYLKTLEMDPNFPVAHIWLARAYEQKGMYEEAVAEYQKKLTILSGDTQGAAALGRAYRVSGLRGILWQQLEELERLSKERYVSPLDMASIYTRLGEKDQAFEWLEKAYEQRFGLLAWLKLDPSLDSLRLDPKFDALLKKIGLGK